MGAGKVAVWTGGTLSALSTFPFIASGVFKLMGSPQVEQGFAHLALPLSMMKPLAVLEISCAVIYLIPATSVLGAILLTGFVGGAICTHWRSGDPFVVQTILGILVWLGLYLREPRLKALIPLRRP